MYMKLYHLSSDTKNTKFLFPRVPRNLYEDEFGNVIEDSKTERICWSRTIGGALRAIVDTHGLGRFTVYSKEFDEKDITYPTKKQVLQTVSLPKKSGPRKSVWLKERVLSERIIRAVIMGRLDGISQRMMCNRP